MASHIALQQVSIAAHKSQYGIRIFLVRSNANFRKFHIFQWYRL